MAYNWLMMTSFGDDNWSSGSLGLLTDKTKKTRTAVRLKPRLKKSRLLTMPDSEQCEMQRKSRKGRLTLSHSK